MKTETITYAERDGLLLQADFYRSSQSSARTVIYFHGGGLMYGSRKDLAEEYISLFLDNGYHFLAVDYRLAPETKLPEIYRDVTEAIQWFHDEAAPKWQLETKDYILLGQSSGAYLALLAASDPLISPPVAVLSFYGYSSLKANWLIEKNDHYAKFARLSESLVKTMIYPHEIAASNVAQRFPLYVYARQTGNWLEMVLGDSPSEDLLATYSLKEEQDFHFLPPLFLAHSRADQDVPVTESERLARGTLVSAFYPVEDLPHDFDTKTTAAEGKEAYQAAIRFLAGI
ncbi:alpha/beta hydrolase [Listeria costaricensis]|uniref:alpha/beta hydrolase n=1 Tax=Listeria costaricensis TaxID=2026604 RepID=UPI0013C4CDF9|nr:alpha/beta hydrolase [Listeria costaricensis]